MQTPRRLQSGDRIALVAPASPFSREEFDRGVAEVRRLGFEPVYDERVFARDRYVAGSADVRAKAFRDAWSDRSIAAVVGVRGGYGSAQILPLLDRDELQVAIKAFIGYSDLTALLTYLTTGCGIVAFHGPMIDRRLSHGADGYDRASFERALCVAEPMGELAPPGLECVRAGEATGPLLGGTMTQLVASLGTQYAFDPPSRYVLFLDEVGERPYRLDRMVTQLRQSGLLAQATAVVIGELPRCDEPNGELTGRAVMADLLRDFSGPVVIGFPSGHTIGPTFTLPFGVGCRVIAGAANRLVIEEAAVR
ncbi:MAG TPA: LD-carboxypeptidase [Vicinamibacterales bacterium]|nr:LD-carboxypeptidase [Vicinamibacterales bacterium]